VSELGTSTVTVSPASMRLQEFHVRAANHFDRLPQQAFPAGCLVLSSLLLTSMASSLSINRRLEVCLLYCPIVVCPVSPVVRDHFHARIKSVNQVWLVVAVEPQTQY